jgi:hypothetical protein
MVDEIRVLMSELGGRARIVAFALVSGIARLVGLSDYDTILAGKSPQAQRRITVLALAGLLGASLLAAQFGWIGMLVFLMAVVLIIN